MFQAKGCSSYDSIAPESSKTSGDSSCDSVTQSSSITRWFAMSMPSSYSQMSEFPMSFSGNRMSAGAMNVETLLLS